LLGADLDIFYIGVIDVRDFYVKLMLRDKLDVFKSTLYGVYGPAQPNRKEAFLLELANVCLKETLPFVIGGDFNIMRHPDDKSTDNFESRWPNLFNAVIETLQLKEIVMSSRQYTWDGPGDNPTYEKLDRVLFSTGWEHNYPLSTVESRDRNISNHTPLILNTGVFTHQNRQPTFKFERGWLTREGFFDMVVDI
jgi:endonuclease/exonuclease/phosphatase family metal-dependent hydrolase